MTSRLALLAFSTDPLGHCYSRALTAAGGLVTAIVDGAGCEDH